MAGSAASAAAVAGYPVDKTQDQVSIRFVSRGLYLGHTAFGGGLSFLMVFSGEKWKFISLSARSCLNELIEICNEEL